MLSRTATRTSFLFLLLLLRVVMQTIYNYIKFNVLSLQESDHVFKVFNSIIF